MDANENSFGSPLLDDGLSLHRYPDPKQHKLREKFAEYRGVKPDQVFVGVGSDEAIDLIIRIFCTPGKDEIIVCPPTYGMYEVAAQTNDVAVKKAPLTEHFQPDVEAIEAVTTDQSKILFLCSPNNPTGNDLDSDIMESIIRDFPGIVVVDEAYIDFTNQPSFAASVEKYPNLVVTQTFSKAFGLAGARVGIAIASQLITGYLLKIKSPYNLSSIAQNEALKALEQRNIVEENIDNILRERRFLRDTLEQNELVYNVFPSDANFLLFQIEDAKAFYQFSVSKGVICRYRGNEKGCENGIRVTVGTRAENELFLKVLEQWTTITS